MRPGRRHKFSSLSLACDAVSGLASGRLPALGGGGALALARGLAPVLENDVPDRGVRGRHGVEAGDLFHLVVERPALDHPTPHFLASAPAFPPYSHFP